MTVLRVAESSAAWALPKFPLVGDLPDLNVWLALVLADHPHHAAARRYWDEVRPGPAVVGPQIWFCRATMLGLVRLLSQPKVMGTAALTVGEAHAVYLQLRHTSGVGFVPDTEIADTPLSERLTLAPSLPARLWTDAWLCATADSAGLRLVSFDVDFERLAPARLLRLH
ncbi:MAG: TA system VapC family ribonuclease toxin [Rhodoferax sp.]